MTQPSTVRQRVYRVVAVIFAIAMIALFPALVAVLVTDSSFLRHHLDAQATITSVRVNTNCSGAPVVYCTDQYYPTVRFLTDEGRAIEAETADFRAADPSAVRKGKAILVHYNPDDPREVRLGTGWGTEDWGLIGLVVVAYGGFGFIAARAIRRRRARRRRPGSAVDATSLDG